MFIVSAIENYSKFLITSYIEKERNNVDKWTVLSAGE